MAMDWQNLKNFLSHNIKQSALTRIKQLGNFSDPIPPTPRGKKKKKKESERAPSWTAKDMQKKSQHSITEETKRCYAGKGSPLVI